MFTNGIGFFQAEQKTFILNSNSLDEITLYTQEKALSFRVDDKNAKRYAFLIDNALYRWLEHGAEGKVLTVTFARRLFTPLISVEMEGERLDPYDIKTSDYGSGGNDIIILSGQLPDFEYRDGRNVISLELKRERSLIRDICIVAVTAIILGVFGKIFLTEDIRLKILDTVVSPLVDAFFNLLRCIAGPMVFLSVTWGICGIGDTRMFGKVGKYVLLYSVLVTLLGAFIGAFSFMFLGNGFTGGSFFNRSLSSLFEMILGIVPPSITEPFTTGNTLQIIFMAAAVGIALISISHKTKEIVDSVNQLNLLIQRLMSAVSLLVPFIVFLLLTDIIWTNSLYLLLPMWKFFLAVITSFVVISLVICLTVALRYKIPLIKVMKKNLSGLVIALTTASSAAAFGSNISAAKERCGISDVFTGFSIPLGMIVHNPIAACYNMVIVIYFASVYEISCSLGWLVIGIIVCTIIAISTPPIPGGAALSYALLIMQMGIPEEALGIILVVDVITDFIVTAFECYVLPISLVNIAGRLNQLDIEKLRK